MPNSIRTQLQGEIRTDEMVNEQINTPPQLIKTTTKKLADKNKCTNKTLSSAGRTEA